MTPSCPQSTTAWLQRHGFAERNKQISLHSDPFLFSFFYKSFQLFHWQGYLCWNANKKQPFLFGISAVVDDLTARQARVAVKDFDWLRVALHAPVVHGIVCDQGDGVQRDPLPESHIICHCVSLHLALHLNVKDLQGLCSWKHEEMRLTSEPPGSKQTSNLQTEPTTRNSQQTFGLVPTEWGKKLNSLSF